METARRLKTVERQQSESYLVVVTYDALHLGSNTEFEAMFGSSFVTKLKNDFGDPLPVPLQNIFFMAIEEFECLLAMLREKRTTWRQVMMHAQQNDSKRETHKFSFIQHLDSMGISAARLPRLQKALDGLYERCTQRVASP